MIELKILKELIYKKTNVSKGLVICHYQHFLARGFKFQPYVCKGCHDILVMSINFSDIAILKINRTYYQRN